MKNGKVIKAVALQWEKLSEEEKAKYDRPQPTDEISLPVSSGPTIADNMATITTDLSTIRAKTASQVRNGDRVDQWMEGWQKDVSQFLTYHCPLYGLKSWQPHTVCRQIVLLSLKAVPLWFLQCQQTSPPTPSRLFERLQLHRAGLKPRILLSPESCWSHSNSCSLNPGFCQWNCGRPYSSKVS